MFHLLDLFTVSGCSSPCLQGDQGQTNISKGALCYDHFFATSCVFSGIFLVNSMLMNLAASVFYSSGISSLTSQDALSLLDQVSIGLVRFAS